MGVELLFIHNGKRGILSSVLLWLGFVSPFFGISTVLFIRFITWDRSRSLCSLGNKYGIIAQLFHYPSGDNMIFPPTHSFPIPFDAGEICCTQNNDKIEQRLKQNNVCLLSLTTHHFNPRSILCAFAILFIPKYLKVEDNKKRKLKNVIRDGQTRRNKQEPKKWKCQRGWDGDGKSGQLFSVSQFLFLNNI